MRYAVALGQLEEMQGLLASLVIVPTLKNMFYKVLELDSGYTAAYHALGVIYYEVPSFAGGDLQQAENLLLNGLSLDPNYTGIRLDLAKVYQKQHRYNAARRELNFILETSEPTYPVDYFLEDKPAAESLLQKLNKKNLSPERLASRLPVSGMNDRRNFIRKCSFLVPDFFQHLVEDSNFRFN
ncbi:MAG: tetratricopeptide repeat protein [bacterium]